MIRTHVLICGGTGCTSGGSQAIADGLKVELDTARNLLIIQ